MSATASTPAVANVRLHSDTWWARTFALCSTAALRQSLAFKQGKLDHPHPRATERARLINEDAVRHYTAEIARRTAPIPFPQRPARTLMDALTNSARYWPEHDDVTLLHTRPVVDLAAYRAAKGGAR